MYNPKAHKFGVCSTLEEQCIVDSVSVTKLVWFDEATEDGLHSTIFPVHFDYQQVAGKQTNQLTQATIDAIQELH